MLCYIAKVILTQDFAMTAKLSRNFFNMFMYNFLKKKTVNSPINVLPLISATSKNQKKVYKHLPFLKTLLLTNVSHPKEALIRKIIA